MPTVTIKPTSTIAWSSNSLSVLPSGTVNGVLSDGSDSTYVGGGSAIHTGFVNVGLGDIAISGTQKVYGAQLQIRNGREPSSTKSSSTSWYLLDANGVQQTTTFSTLRSDSAAATQSGPVYSQFGSNLWTQSRINSMSLYGAFTTDSLNWFQRVYDVSCVVTYLTQPTVTGTPTVTNVTNNAQPTVSWVYNQVDSAFNVGPQVAYRVKIFDAATIAGGGFSPDTSTPAWDSGDVSDPTGATASAMTGPLGNGVTYTAYVKVAKLNNDYATNWWSNWATSATFSLTFYPPTVPVISNLRLLAEQCRYRTVMDVFAPVNLLDANTSSIETSAAGWSVLLNCALTRVTTQHLSGVAALQLSSVASGTMQAITATNLRVDEGVTYTALASFKTAVSARSCAVGIRWIAADLTVLSTTFGANVTDATGSWIQASYSAAAPSGAYFAAVVLQVASTGGASEIHYADQMDLHAGSGTTWSLGGYATSNGAGTFYGGLIIERRECVDDRRGPAYNWFSKQIASGGSVLGQVVNGFTWDTGHSVAEWVWLSQLIGQVGYVAPGAARWKNVSSAAQAYFDVGRDAVQTDWRYAPSVVPSQAHTFSCWAWIDSDARTFTPQIIWLDGTGATISTSSGSNLVASTTPQRMQCTATAPSNAVYAYGRVLDITGGYGPHVYLTTFGFGFGTQAMDDNEPMGLDQATWTQLQFTGNDTNLLLSASGVGLDTGQTETYPDFEAPAVRPVAYRASITYFDPTSGNTIFSGYATPVPTYPAVPARTLLQSVTDQTLGCVVSRRKASALAYAFDAQVFHPLGSDAAPVQVRDWTGGEDGTLEVVIASEAQSQRLSRLLTTQDVLVVDWAQGGRSYVLITGVSLQETVSGDTTVCDADGSTGNLRYAVISLTYVETVGPNTVQ